MVLNKGQARIDEAGEAFTPDHIIDKMLGMLTPEAWQENKTFLDPACGNGHMLVRFLQCKILKDHNPIKALSTVYGADIKYDNVVEARLRLLSIVNPLIRPEQYELTGKIVTHNVFLVEDSLTFDWDNYKPFVWENS